MNDDTSRKDPWHDGTSGDGYAVDEEAIYAADPDEMTYQEEWDDETEDYLEEEDYAEAADDVDASFYEPPEPPLTDADFEPEEQPEKDDSWLRENWWRFAILILVIIVIIFFLVRSCTNNNKKMATQTPTPIITRIATFTATPASQAPINSSPAPTAVIPAAQPTPEPPPTQPSAPTQPPAPTAKFTIGQTVVVTNTGTDRLSFRAGPGTNYARLALLKDGAQLTVIGGPEKAGGYTWWRLKTSKGKVGWAIENNLAAQ